MDIVCRQCGHGWKLRYLRYDCASYRCPHGWAARKDGSGRWVHASPLGRRGDGIPCRRRNGRGSGDADMTLMIEVADNGTVPRRVRRWYQRGQPGWYRYVTLGHGCLFCHGRPERTIHRPRGDRPGESDARAAA